MATIRFFTKALKSLHYTNVASWDAFQTGQHNPAYDDPGVLTLEDSPASIRIRGGIHQSGEPSPYKFGSNSRVGISIYTGTLPDNAILSSAKLSVQLITGYDSGDWQITPSLHLVAFSPQTQNITENSYLSTDYNFVNKSLVISSTIIPNSSLTNGTRIEFDITNISKNAIVQFGEGADYGGHTNLAIVNNYDLNGGIAWNPGQYKEYSFYDHNSDVANRSYLDLEFTESKSFYFNWFTNEDITAPDDPALPPGAGDEHWGDVGLLIPGDENYADISDNPVTVTASSSANYQTTIKKWVGALRVGENDADDYFSVFANSKYQNLDGDFTMECWIYRVGGGEYNAFASWAYFNASFNGNWSWRYANNTFQFILYDAQVNQIQLDGASGDFPTDTWLHIALSRVGTGTNNLKMYANGKLISQTTFNGTLMSGSSQPLKIGSANWGYGDYTLESYIDDFRITKGTGRYTGDSTSEWGNFSEPDSAFPTDSGGGGSGDGLVEGQKGDQYWDNVVGYYRFNGDYEDRSEQSGDIEILGTAEITTADQWAGTGALSLSNAYSYHSAIRMYGDTVNFGTEDFCIEMQFKIPAGAITVDTDYYLFDFRSISTSSNIIDTIVIRKTGGVINLKVNKGVNTYTIQAIDEDTWYHFAISRKTTNISYYVNGVKSATVSPIATDNIGGQEIWINSRVDNIGSVYYVDGQGLNIFIDDLRITKGYFRYDATFTELGQEHYDYEIPTSVGDLYWSDTSLLMRFNETSIYDYSAGDLDLFTGLPSDGSKTQKTVNMQGTPSVTFDSANIMLGNGALSLDSSSYLILPNHAEYDFGVDDFTIEFYVKPTGTDSGNQWIFSFDGESGFQNDWRLGLSSPTGGNTGRYVVFQQTGNGIGSGTQIESPVYVLIDEWNKVSLSRKENSGSADFVWYISRSSGQSSETDSGLLVGLNNITGDRYIGYSATNTSEKFIGYLDEIRINNGNARYSATTADPFEVTDSDLEEYPTIQQYWDYEEPFNSMEIEDTDLDIKHYIEYIVPFPNEKVQFLNEGLSFVPLINWGDLVDGIDTRDETDKVFNFIDGKNVFTTHWEETATDKILDVTTDFITQDAIDDLNVYNASLTPPVADNTLETSAETFGSEVKEKFIYYSEELAIEPITTPVIDGVKKNFLDDTIELFDKWTENQFQFGNGFITVPDFKTDNTDMGTYTDSDSDPVSVNYIFDNRFAFSLDETIAPTSQVPEGNEWYKIVFDNEIFSSSENLLPIKDTIETRDTFFPTNFVFESGFSIIRDLALKLTDLGTSELNEANLQYESGEVQFDSIYAPDHRTAKEIDPSMSQFIQDIINFEQVKPIVSGQQLNEVDETIESIDDMFTEEFLSWDSNGNIVVNIDGYYSYPAYTTQLNSSSQNVDKWNNTDLIVGTVFDEEIQKQIITGLKFDSEEKFEISSIFTLEEKFAFGNVLGNWWHQSYQFNNSLDLVLDRRYAPDEYEETYSNFQVTFFSVPNNNRLVSGDSFKIYKENENSGTTLLTDLDVVTETPSPITEPDDSEWANVAILLPFNGNNTNLATGSGVGFTNSPGYQYLTHNSIDIYNDSLDEKPDGWGVNTTLQVVKSQDLNVVASQGLILNSNIVASDEITIDWWMWRSSEFLPPTTPSQEFIFIDGEPSSSADKNGLSTRSDNSNSYGTYDWRYYDSSSIFGWSDIDDLGWHHWAFVRESDDTVKFYRDGIEVASGSKSGNIEIERILCGFHAYFKNFRVTVDVARWTSNFNNTLNTLRGEWSVVDNQGVLTRYDSDARLYLELSNNPQLASSEGFGEYKTATDSTSGNKIVGWLSWEYDTTWASLEDDRWQFGCKPIGAFDIKAGGSRPEVHPPVFLSDEYSIDPSTILYQGLEYDGFYTDSSRFYNFVQVFGGTLLPDYFLGNEAGDDDWDNVVFLLQSNTTTDGSTTFIGEGLGDHSDTPHTVTAGADVKHKTAGAKSGFWDSSFYFDGTGAEKLTITDDYTDFTFASDPYTIELWFYRDALSGNSNYSYLFETRPGSNGYYPAVYIDPNNSLVYYVNSGAQITSGNLSLDTWYHLAIVRNASDVTTMYVNGKAVGSTWTDNNAFVSVSRFVIGNGDKSGNDAYPLNGYINDFRVTKGVARYSGTNTSTEWSNFDEITEALPLETGGVNPLNVTTIGGVEVLLQEEQTDRQYINMPLNDGSISGTVDVSGDKFVGYVIQPEMPGLDDLTRNNFQFLGDNIVVIDSRIKKYEDAVTDNSYKMVSGGFDVLIDSGQYLDTQVDVDGNYVTTGNNSNTIPNAVHTVDSGVRKVVYSGGSIENLLGAGNFYETHSSSAPQNIIDPYRVDFDEKFDIGTTDVVLGQNSDRSTKTENWSKDQFSFINGRCDIILDSSFESEHPFSGTVFNPSTPPTNTMLQTIFEGRISLDVNLVNQYNNDGSKNIKLQSIFDDEEYTIDSATVVNDNYPEAVTWNTLNWMEEDILEIANFGGAFFQFLNEGFNPLADTIKLADFGDSSSSNTFLNLVSQTVDDVDYLYTIGTGILKLTLDPAKANVATQYDVGEYVWVGKLIENEGDIKLDINLHKFWQVVAINTTFNTIDLLVPSSDAGNFITPPTGDEEGVATLLLSSTNMTSLMYYYRRL